MRKQSIDVVCVEKLKRGDSEAFNVVYEHYKDHLYYFALSLSKNNAEAEDIVQETFIKVITKVDKLHNNHAFHTWLFKLAHNEAKMKFRSGGKIELFEEDDMNQIIIEKDSPTTLFDSKAIMDATIEEIEKLPKKYIQVAQLYYLNDLTIRNVAEILELPKSTVGNYVKHIEETLQKNLEKKGFSPKKYLSVGIVPFLYEAFLLYSNKNKLSALQSASIKNNILSNKSVNAKINNAAEISNSWFSNIAQSIALKVTLVVISVASIGFVIYELASKNNNPSTSQMVSDEKNQPDFKYIKQVVYSTLPTRGPIEVSVTLATSISLKDVEVTYKQQNIKFNQENTMFEAKENGIYILKVKEERFKIEISNIDLQLPVVTSIDANKDYVIVNTKDEANRIDYAKSYLKYNGTKYTMDEQGKVMGHFQNDVTIYLFDKKGNLIEFTSNIKNGI